jgi:serine-type D-Ala-D-Ala carboxypeptidase/endopeptidase
MSMRTPSLGRTCSAALAILAMASAPGAAQSPPSDSAIQRWITERVANGYATGIVVGRRQESGLLIVSAGGAQRNGRPIDGESIFEIGSITKVFTNILLADMVLKGEVALEDPVQKFLPAG